MINTIVQATAAQVNSRPNIAQARGSRSIDRPLKQSKRREPRPTSTPNAVLARDDYGIGACGRLRFIFWTLLVAVTQRHVEKMGECPKNQIAALFIVPQ
jgi:hypothetical protein